MAIAEAWCTIHSSLVSSYGMQKVTTLALSGGGGGLHKRVGIATVIFSQPLMPTCMA